MALRTLRMVTSWSRRGDELMMVGFIAIIRHAYHVNVL